MKSSRRASLIGFSPTIAIDEKARALTVAGRKIWNFGAGQPDFPTPASAARAGAHAIEAGITKYTSPAGTRELRAAIAEKLRRDNLIPIETEDVLVTAGAKPALYLVMAAVLDPGDEVLIPAPYWVSYTEQVRFLDAVPRLLPTDEASGFKLTPAALTQAISPRTRLLLLNTPCNPTGAVYSRAELEALGRVIIERDLLLVTDEIYERIVYDGAEHVSAAALSAELCARTMTVNGVSKAFSMTGWRIGYAAGPSAWIGVAESLQSQLIGNACSISQEATRAALANAETEVVAMVQAFARRRTRVIELLKSAPGLRLLPPAGTFYAFPDVSAYLGRRVGSRVLSNPTDLCAWLLEEASVALVPGEAFGSDRHVRISFATADSVIEEGLGAMVRALGRLG